MSETATTVVFDFDLTLTKFDTADRFFRWLLKRDTWRLALVLAAFPVVGALLLVRSTCKWPIRYAVWVATLGRSHHDLQLLVHEHAAELFANPSSVFLEAGLRQLQLHLDRGHRVVIATGCLGILASELLRRAGYGQVPLVASTLHPFLGGMARHEHCFGRNKIPMLTTRGFAPPWDITYTDHRCDLPVLTLSRDCYLINPTPECRRLIEQVLASRTTVLAWS